MNNNSYIVYGYRFSSPLDIVAFVGAVEKDEEQNGVHPDPVEREKNLALIASAYRGEKVDHVIPLHMLGN